MFRVTRPYFRLPKLTSARLLQCISALLAVVSLATGLGIPLPLPAPKDLSSPFPCQSRGCSCRDAQMCWSECRCQTLEEKLAWCFESRVAPPPKFAAQFSKYAANRRLRPQATAAFATKSVPPCGCGAKPAEDESDAAPKKAARELAKSPAVVLLEVARCRGVSPGVYSLSEALPIDGESFELRLPPGEWIEMPAEFGCNDRAEPLKPPPRLPIAA